MNCQSSRPLTPGFPTAALLLVAMAWTDVAAQVQFPPPDVDHYAVATPLIAPAAARLFLDHGGEQLYVSSPPPAGRTTGGRGTLSRLTTLPSP